MWDISEDILSKAHEEIVLSFFYLKIKNPENFKNKVSSWGADLTMIGSEELNLINGNILEVIVKPQLLNNTAI